MDSHCEELTNMRRLLILLSCIVLAFALCACATNGGESVHGNGDLLISLVEEEEGTPDTLELPSFVVLPEPEEEKPEAYPFTLAVGDAVSFGNYNGETLNWIVSAVDGDNVLLVSQYLIPCSQVNRMFDSTVFNSKWEASSMRSWLNRSFLAEAFTEEETTYIVPAVSGDLVSLPSKEEVDAFTGDMELLATRYKDDAYASSWWLRSAGTKDGNIAYVNGRGSIVETGMPANYTMGVRPMVWVRTPKV